jgi:predicted ATP-grasp superfamily ATP-dependent carboligase
MKSAALPPAYVLGGGLLALGIVRSLGRRGVPVTIFKEGDADISFSSRYVRGIALGPPGHSHAAADRIIDEARKESRKPVLLAAGDSNLLTACLNEDRLRQHLCMVLPPLEAAETVINKDRFQSFATRHAVPVPRGWHPANVAELRMVLDAVRFPVVLKPARSADWHTAAIVSTQGRTKMFRVDGPDQLLAEWTRIAGISSPPLIQEYVRGEDDAHFSYVSYRDRSGRELTSFCVQKLRLNPIHGGFATFARVVGEPGMEVIGRRALDQLEYRGAASVCFKRDSVSGEPYIFEINGRIPLAHGAGLLVGIDLPWLMYGDALGLPQEPIQAGRSHGHWLTLTYDIWAMLDYRRAGEIGLAAWLRSLLKVRHVVELDARDPGPFGYFLRGLMRSGCNAILRRRRGN